MGKEKKYTNGFEEVAKELEAKQDQAIYRSHSKLKQFDGKEGSTVLPIWSKYEHIKFDGSAKIHSAEDVAFLMKSLENKNIEHAFAIHVNKDKDPFIQFVGMGGKGSVLFDTDIIMAGAEIFKPEKIYMVHNHPTGSLKPSGADLQLTEAAKHAFGNIGIDVEHIILNTYKNYFTVIDIDDRYNPSHSHLRPLENNDAVPMKAFLFDGAQVLMEPLGKIKNSRNAAEIIQQYRFSALPKIGVLPTNLQLEVLGNFLLDDVNVKDIAEIVSRLPSGKNVILYGNQANENISSIQEELKSLRIELLDYIQIDSNSPSIVEAYKSYADEGVLRELQEKYGTSTLSETNELNESKTLKR